MRYQGSMEADGKKIAVPSVKGKPTIGKLANQVKGSKMSSKMKMNIRKKKVGNAANKLMFNY